MFNIMTAVIVINMVFGLGLLAGIHFVGTEEQKQRRSNLTWCNAWVNISFVLALAYAVPWADGLTFQFCSTWDENGILKSWFDVHPQYFWGYMIISFTSAAFVLQIEDHVMTTKNT